MANMANPTAFFATNEIKGIENCCSDQGGFHFAETCCTRYSQAAGPHGTAFCAICLNTRNTEDIDDPNANLMQRNNKCIHEFHVGCISSWTATYANCPLCRCVWYIDTPQQEHLDWVRDFVNEIAAGHHQDEYNAKDEFITICRFKIANLIKILNYFLLSRGAESTLTHRIGAATLPTPRGRAVAEAIMSSFRALDGQEFQKKDFLKGRMMFLAYNELTRNDANDAVCVDTLFLASSLLELLYATYDIYFAHVAAHDAEYV